MESLRRIVAWLVIGAFSVAAAFGIYALLSPGPFGSFEADILLTTLVVGLASLAALCHLTSASSRWWPVGALAAAVTVVPVLMSLAMIWLNVSGQEAWWDVYGISVTWALTLTQLSLLGGLSSKARRRLDWLLIATAAVAVALAALITMLVLSNGEFGDGVMRILGVLAILDTLGSLTLIALRVFGGREERRDPIEAPLTLDAARSRRLRTLAAEQGVSAEAMLDRLLAPASGGDDLRDRHPGVDR
ncbi:hypothetical protein EHW97_00795 [Aeromicrobium camelliae]|uniref:Uncharacterized protein n=1 Tax=Aeromicrobium camelliae TaxID=1538144 RepID=A0A3N6ZST6_9ACTN|nr:hypothetical protein [Aeromicrobium camelliae]RQN10067.1 hypothetical protein EHW97_00795 [Aeromicrobium camelliae]